MLAVWLATETGITVLRRRDEKWRLWTHTLQGQDVNVVAHQPGESAVVYAGTYGKGLFRTTDGGRNWDKLDLPIAYVRSLAFAPDNPRTVYVGGEPADLFVSLDGGNTWDDLQIRRLPESRQWSLPYSPRGGALRSLALHPANPALIYGAIEQGGVLRSTDKGASWTITHDGVHPDVHSLAVDAENPAILFAATGGGLFRTRDSGQSWQKFFNDYTRAVALHPLNPQIVVAGPAPRVGEGGRIVISRNGGEDWEPAGAGLELPLPDMVQHLVMHPAHPQTLFAVRSGGEVWRTDLEPLEWRPLEPKVAKVQDLNLATAES